MLMPLSQAAAKLDHTPQLAAQPHPQLPVSTPQLQSHDDDDNLTSDPLEAMKQLHQHLEELREAPQDQQKRRRSRRLQKKECSDDPPTVVPPVSPSTPGKRRPHQSRRGRGRAKEEQLLDSQISDSQLLQVIYDDPDGRREKEKLLARIRRWVRV